MAFQGQPQPSPEYPNATPEARLFFHLTNVLYSNCYTGREGQGSGQPANPEDAMAFVKKLKAANRNRENA